MRLLLVRYMQHSVHIWPMNKIFPIISLIWFRNGFSKVQRGCNDIKIVYISNFSQFRSRGGGHRKSIFPKFKKVQIILGGGGGSRKFWPFPQFVTFFVLNPPLTRNQHNFNPNFFFIEKLFSLNLFFKENFIQPNFFWPKILFDRKIIFIKNFVDLKNYFHQNFIGLKKK